MGRRGDVTEKPLNDEQQIAPARQPAAKKTTSGAQQQARLNRGNARTDPSLIAFIQSTLTS